MNRNPFSHFVVVLSMLLGATLCFAQKEVEKNEIFFDGLGRLVSPELLPMFRTQRMLEASSYDRAGDNDDGFAGTYSTIRTEENGEHVFFEDTGPACVYRIWTASYGGNVSVYFDGAKEPEYHAPFKDFLGGDVAPMVKPLCDYSSGGLNCYFPLCYEKSIKMTLDEKPLFFQISFSRAEQPEKIFSYTRKNLAGIPAYIILAKKMMESRGGLTLHEKPEKTDYSGSLEPGAETEIFSDAASGSIKFIYLTPPDEDAKKMKDITIKMFWDGEATPAVESSLLRFFATDFEITRYRSQFVGRKKNDFYCYFPMPFAKGARVTLTNNGNEAVPVSGYIGYTRAPMPENFGYFHAGNRRMVSEQDKPIVINDISGGRGHWVGTAISVIRKKGEDDKFHFLEGDERVYIDGETEPIWSGTGTEDYFGGAWYFTSGEFSRSFNGAPVIGKPRSRIAMYRFHYTDAIPFEKSIYFEIEHGSKNNEPGVLYDVVSYWYQSVPGKTGL